MSANIIRYVRPLTIHPSTTDQFGNSVVSYSNLGGIVLVFNIDYDKSLLNVAFSVCSSSDNFDKVQGLMLAANQYKNNEQLVIPYDKNIPLVDNVTRYLCEWPYALKNCSSRLKTFCKELFNILEFNNFHFHKVK